MSFVKPFAALALAGLLVSGTHGESATAAAVEQTAVAEAPVLVALSSAEMEAVQGAGCLTCRIVCGIAASATFAVTKSPGAALFVGLACMEALDPTDSG